MQLSIHNCTGIAVRQHMPTNANSIQLVVETCDRHGNYSTVNVVMFDLPECATDALIEAFGPLKC